MKFYVDCVARFATHFGKSPENLGAEEVRIYLMYLVRERKVAWDTYRQALAALRFLYRWGVGERRRRARYPRAAPGTSLADNAQFRRSAPLLRRHHLVQVSHATDVRLRPKSSSLVRSGLPGQLMTQGDYQLPAAG